MTKKEFENIACSMALDDEQFRFHLERLWSFLKKGSNKCVKFRIRESITIAPKGYYRLLKSNLNIQACP